MLLCQKLVYLYKFSADEQIKFSINAHRWNMSQLLTRRRITWNEQTSMAWHISIYM